MQVADLAALTDDAALLAVADMRADDVGLVQIHVVEEYANAAVVVDVARGDQHVAVALDQADAVATLADDDTVESELHGAVGFNAIRVGVLSNDLQPTHRRGPLFRPYIRLDGLWRGGAR